MRGLALSSESIPSRPDGIANPHRARALPLAGYDPVDRHAEDGGNPDNGRETGLFRVGFDVSDRLTRYADETTKLAGAEICGLAHPSHAGAGSVLHSNHGYHNNHGSQEHLGQDEEAAANYVGAALQMPRRAFLRALAERPDAWHELGPLFGATSTSAAIRAAELEDRALAVVTPGRVYPHLIHLPEPEIRRLARDGATGLARTRLEDDPRRIVLEAEIADL